MEKEKEEKVSVPRDTYAGAAQSLHDRKETVDREERRTGRTE